MRRLRKLLFPAAGPMLLALGACASSAPQTRLGAIPAPSLPTGTIIAVRHADPGQSAAALNQIMSVLGQPMPGNAGPGTEVVIRMQDGSVKSVAGPADSGFATGQRVTVTKTSDGIVIHPI